MDQNIIAVIWDFDKTFVNGYMQRLIFEEYKVGVDSLIQNENLLSEVRLSIYEMITEALE